MLNRKRATVDAGRAGDGEVGNIEDQHVVANDNVLRGKYLIGRVPHSVAVKIDPGVQFTGCIL